MCFGRLGGFRLFSGFGRWGSFGGLGDFDSLGGFGRWGGLVLRVVLVV